MLLHLSEKLGAALDTGVSLPDHVVQALQNIAQARSQGDHIVTGDPAVLDSIANHGSLSPTTRKVFDRIRSEQPQVGALRQKLQTYVFIAEFAGDETRLSVDGREVIQIPLQRFSRADLTQPTILVAENLLDCELLFKISQWYLGRYARSLPKTLQAMFVPGGGDTTDRALSYLTQNQRYFVACVVDRDQNSPREAEGQTAAKCRRVSLPPTCTLHVLGVRSAENLLSVQQLNAIFSTDHTRKHFGTRAQLLSCLEGNDAWKYFPFKGGIQDKEGPHRPGTGAHYWREVYESTGAEIIDVEGTKFLFPPFSSKLLRWCVEHLDTNEPAPLDHDSFLKEIWGAISAMLAAWCCGTEPMRI